MTGKQRGKWDSFFHHIVSSFIAVIHCPERIGELFRLEKHRIKSFAFIHKKHTFFFKVC